MRSGLSDQQLEAQLVASDEFYKTARGTNTAWIDAMDKLLLHSDFAVADSSWIEQLNEGQTRLQVAERIAGSAENETQLINDNYFHYLGRTSDPVGLAYWLQQSTDGKTNEEIIAGFAGSEEFIKQHTS